MGSSQSIPTRTSQFRRSPHPATAHSASASSTATPRAATPAPDSGPTPTSSRLSFLRRLSLLSRKDSQKRSRSRTQSTEGSDCEQKKRRVGSEPEGEVPSSPSEPSAPSTSTPYPPHPASTQINASTTEASVAPTEAPSTPGEAVSPPSLTRRSTSSTIARTHVRPPSTRNLSSGLSLLSSSLIDEASTPGLRSSTPLPSSLSAAPEGLPADHDTSVEDLTRQLEQARADLAETRRQLEQADNAARESTGASDAQSAMTPRGSMLVIQGLAQTSAPGQTSGNGGPNRRSRQSPENSSRWGSPFSFTGRNRGDVSPSEATGNTSTEASDNSGRRTDDSAARESLDHQVRMISSLLTVAAAVTATTLLAPEDILNSNPPASGTNPLSSFFERFRPQRLGAANVETALGSYLRTALRRQWSNEQDQGISGRDTPLSTPLPPNSVFTEDFQRFLSGTTADVTDAVHAFAREDDDSTDEDSQSPPVPASDASAMPVLADDSQQSSNLDAEGTESTTSPSSIPSFHFQRGQNTPDNPRRRFGITGGSDGVPRRMNLFRAHVFPPRQEGSSDTEEDPNGMVPCIFVGVSSVPNTYSLSNEGPLNMGSHVGTTNSAAPNAIPTEDQEVAGEAASTSTERRSFRERVRERISQRSQPQQDFINTFAVVVIGGYYPRSHPVLSIPSLMSGGPLTDEELALVSELIGQTRPSTASREDIEKSGLAVVDASDIPGLVQQGKVLDNCHEKCLVCLCEYEEGEQCRVLQCRHAYHKDCVDQWLSEGGNTCPACRSEAVRVSSGTASGSQAPVTTA